MRVVLAEEQWKEVRRAGRAKVVEAAHQLLALVSSECGSGTPNSPLKKPPGEGTGPTIQANFQGNLVGRVPSRGVEGVFKRAANGTKGSSPLKKIGCHALQPGLATALRNLRMALAVP